MTTLKVIEEHFFAISLYDHQAEGGGGRVSFYAHLFCAQKYLSILTPLHYFSLTTLSRGRVAQWIAYTPHTQRPLAQILAFTKFFPTIFSMSTVARLNDSTALFQKGIEMTNFKGIEEHFFAISFYDHQVEGGGEEGCLLMLIYSVTKYTFQS